MAEESGLFDRAVKLLRDLGQLRRHVGKPAAILTSIVIASVGVWWFWDDLAKKPGVSAGISEDFVKALAEKAHDLDAARKSVEDAAAVSAGIWISYLFTLLYIGIAAGGVTHKDLLLENAVKLPFLNVDLPLTAFFALAPIIFFISHAYTLMHFVLLAAKVGNFNAELEKKSPTWTRHPMTRSLLSARQSCAKFGLACGANCPVMFSSNSLLAHATSATAALAGC